MRRFLIPIVLFCTGWLSLAYSQEMARGVVFWDKNGNNIQDEDEPGLPLVLVSNGVEVVATAEDGSYELPVADDTILFVIQPSGFSSPRCERNIPRFYYLHKPSGSPSLRYAGVPPTGPLPERIDFPLSAVKTTGAFRALLIGDPQPSSLHEVEYFARSVVDGLENLEDTAFALVLGDIVGDNLELFDPVSEELGRIGVPVYYVFGNHDMNFDAPSERQASETFQRHFGPADYAFIIDGVCFIILDNVRFPLESGSRRYVGGFRPDQLEWLKSLLSYLPREMPLVFAMHIPLFHEFPFGETFRSSEREAFFSLFADRPHTLSLSAHTHTQRHHYFRLAEGWTGEEPHHHYNVGTTSGSWWGGSPDENGIPVPTMRDGTPQGYAFLQFQGASYVVDWVSVRDGQDVPMTVYLPNFIRSGEWYRVIAVNVFNGCEMGRVHYRLTGHGDSWRSLPMRTAIDPTYARALYERDASLTPPAGTRLPDPALVYHLWAGRLPSGLPEGRHEVEVRYTDRWGREFFAQREFHILEESAD